MHLMIGMTGIRKHRKNIILGGLEILFWEAWDLHFDILGCDFGVLGDHFGDPEVPWTPNRTPWGPDLDFSRVLMVFGNPLGPTLESFCRLLRDLDHQIGAQFPELVFQ